MSQRYCLSDHTSAVSRTYLSTDNFVCKECAREEKDTALMYALFVHVYFSFPLVYNYLTISAAGKEDSTVFAGVSDLNQEASGVTCIWRLHGPLAHSLHFVVHLT